MTYQRIPLTTSNQAFTCTLEIDGKNKKLAFSVRYNEIAKYWTMTVTDPTIGSVLLSSIPLLPAGNILGQYAYLQIGSAYVVNTGNTDTDRPGATNLGTDWILVWGDTPK